jgi:hypothetical protein
MDNAPRDEQIPDFSEEEAVALLKIAKNSDEDTKKAQDYLKRWSLQEYKKIDGSVASQTKYHQRIANILYRADHRENAVEYLEIYLTYLLKEGSEEAKKTIPIFKHQIRQMIALEPISNVMDELAIKGAHIEPGNER